MQNEDWNGVDRDDRAAMDAKSLLIIEPWHTPWHVTKRGGYIYIHIYIHIYIYMY